MLRLESAGRSKSGVLRNLNSPRSLIRKSPPSVPVTLQRVIIAFVSSGSVAVYLASTRSVAVFSGRLPGALEFREISGPSLTGETVTVTSKRPSWDGRTVVGGHHGQLIFVVPARVIRRFVVGY